jgi:hypothetical protein
MLRSIRFLDEHVRGTPNGAPLTDRIPAEGPFDLLSGSPFTGDVEAPSAEALCEAARRLNAPADLITAPLSSHSSNLSPARYRSAAIPIQ